MAGTIVTARAPRGDTSDRRMDSAEDRSDSDGRFELVGLEPGDYQLSVDGDLDERPILGESGSEAKGPVLTTAPASDVVLRVARSGWFARGIVRGPDGKPLADAWVSALGLRSGVFSDRDGRFALGELYGDEISVVAAAASQRLRSAKVAVTRGQAEVVLSLSSVTRVEAKVTRGGKPVDAFEVSVDDGPTRVVGRTVDRRRGGFTLPSLLAGTYRIAVKSADGIASQVVAIGANPRVELDFELEPPSAVRGVLVDGDGKPIPDMTVSVSGTAVFGGDLIDRILGRGVPATAADGSFVVSGLLPGTGEIMFLDANRTPLWLKAFVTESGTTVDLGEVGPGATKPFRDTSDDLGVRFFVGRSAPTAADLDAIEMAADPMALVNEKGASLWIASVTPNGPAQRAGLVPGDRVLAVGATVIGTGRSPLQTMISLSEAWRSRGRTVVWRIMRAETEINVDIRLPTK